MPSLKSVIDDAGGVASVSRLLGISPRAIYKWLEAGSLPRTEYSGETDYAQKLARLDAVEHSASEILELCRPSSRDAAA
ncbi:regulatory protein [Alcanivorax xiamenensis]|uniref:Regulatory protein n=1 Tax=Alcanivorax xiamenensis TaxID=1177156 RepID=A0ABQ6Y6K1_9GAMM|nr:regulatory protein [Alcanivorax xiamenensis]